MTETAGRTTGVARAGEDTSETASGLFVLERPPMSEGPADGAVVLLVHGSMDRATSFRRVMRHLPDMTVITYDRRGYAGSVGVATSDDFAVQTGDLVEVLDGRRAVGVGHSLGGNVVLAAAERRPDLLESLVVYETPQPWRPWWPTGTAGQRAIAGAGDPGDVAEGFMRRMVGDRVWQSLPEATRRRRREEGVALQAEMRALHRGRPWDPEAIEVPVVVAYGSGGSDHHRRSAPVLASELPRGRLVEVAGAGHGVHLSHPEQLADLVRIAIGTRQGRP
ncbi:MAG: alpha/beta hydrolase [Actinomycetota bacterium]|nr:alpha/beta hydrolase [Actinomycetota bacterium]